MQRSRTGPSAPNHPLHGVRDCVAQLNSELDENVAATMKDVARLSGVSLATVSAVLSGSSYVSPDLTQRVQRAVQTLGYAPNSVARSLKKGATKLIGLVVPDVTNPFFTGIVHAVQKRARTLGYSVVLCDSERDVEQERSYLKMLRAHLAVGTIFCPSGPEEAYKRLEDDIGIMPVVCVDHAARPGDYDSVVLDNVAAARLATQHVLGLGHRRVAIVAGPQHLMPGRDRLIGFEQTLHGAGLQVAPELVRQGSFGDLRHEQSNADWRHACNCRKRAVVPSRYLRRGHRRFPLGCGLLARVDDGLPTGGRHGRNGPRHADRASARQTRAAETSRVRAETRRAPLVRRPARANARKRTDAPQQERARSKAGRRIEGRSLEYLGERFIARVRPLPR